MPNATELTAFNKAGIATTDANGLAYIYFTHALPAEFQYVVMLTPAVFTPTGKIVNAICYVSNISNTGFLITAQDVEPDPVPVPGLTVYWLLRSIYD